MIFVDCGALYALVVADDPRHSDMESWFLGNTQPLVTTDYCADELLTLLIARKRPALAVATGWKIFNEELCRLHFLRTDQLHRAWTVFQARCQLGWSFTDCTSKVVIEDLGIRAAAALDQHFRQFGTVTILP
jgi:predicted nucleic acid-binding protein